MAIGHSMKGCTCARCEAERARRRERWSSDPAWREKHIQANRARARDSEAKKMTNQRRRDRYRADPAYRQKMLDAQKAHLQPDPDAFRRRKNELALRRRSTPRGWCVEQSHKLNGVTADQLESLLRDQGMRCAATGFPLDFSLPRRHPQLPSIDHIVPVSRGGTDDISNLRVVVWAWNVARGNCMDESALAVLFRRHDEPSEHPALFKPFMAG